VSIAKRSIRWSKMWIQNFGIVRITTVRSREKVVSCLKVWIKTRQEVGLALPKLPKTSKEKKGDVALIEVIAKWAMEIGLVEFIGEKGVGRYYIQD
jgi:hypothetical protein